MKRKTKSELLKQESPKFYGWQQKIKRAVIFFSIPAIIGVIILIFLSVGCGSQGDVPESSKNVSTFQTPQGHKFSMSPIYALYSRTWIIFDAQPIIAEWIDTQVQVCRSKYPNNDAQNIHFEIFNDYAFRCESNTGLCAGWTDRHTIKTTIYAKWKGNEYPGFQTHPNLIRTKEQMKQWTGVNGWITQGSNWYASDLWSFGNDWVGLEVICHELEHCWKKISDKAKLDIHYTAIEF